MTTFQKKEDFRTASPEIQEEMEEEEEESQPPKKTFKPSISMHKASAETNGKGALNSVKVKPLKPKKDTKKSQKKSDEKLEKLWDHAVLMRTEAASKLVDLRRYW